MPEREPIETKNLATLYGNDELEWSRARDLVAEKLATFDAHTFLGTVHPDGRPHAAGVGACWHDGAVLFKSGPKTGKGRDLLANPACTISTSLPGMDLVFEGDATRVTDAATLEAVAAIYNGAGWPVTVEGDTFTAPYSAPSAGPPPWFLFRLDAHTVFAVASAEPHGATRWRF